VTLAHEHQFSRFFEKTISRISKNMKLNTQIRIDIPGYAQIFEEKLLYFELYKKDKFSTKI
jgi:hypothetical protein